MLIKHLVLTTMWKSPSSARNRTYKNNNSQMALL